MKVESPARVFRSSAQLDFEHLHNYGQGRMAIIAHILWILERTQSDLTEYRREIAVSYFWVSNGEGR